MLATDGGISISVKELHFSKASNSIDVIDEGITIFVNSWIPLNFFLVFSFLVKVNNK